MLAKKIVFTILLILSLGIIAASPVLAQVTSPNNTADIVDELVAQTQQVDDLVQVTQEDFGNLKTGWFSNFWRDVRIIFTFDPVKKAGLELEKASAVLLKTNQELAEKSLDAEKIKEKITAANQKYEQVMAKVKKRLEKYKQTHPDDQKLEKFLDKYADFSLKHQMVFESLEDKTPAQVKELLEQRRKAHLKRFMQTMEKMENQQQFKQRFKKMLVDNNSKFGQRVIKTHLLEEVDKLDLDEATKEKIKELKEEVGPLWDELHQTYQQAIQKRQTVIEKLKNEAAKSKDELLNDPQARHEFMRKVNQEMMSVREKNREIYKNKAVEVEQFINQHKDEILEVKKEIKPLIKNKRLNPIKNRPLIPLTNHKVQPKVNSPQPGAASVMQNKNRVKKNIQVQNLNN